MDKALRYYFYFIFVLLCLFLISILFILTPLFYDWIYGNKIIERHIEEIIGNKTDHKEIVPILLRWIKTEVHYPNEDEEVLTLDNGFGIYSINGTLRIFHRGVPASWIIKKKLGRCGEDAIYFVEIMSRLRYKSRKIRPKGWDHAWAEYYTHEGYKILVDPSSNQVIHDPKKWAEGKNWSIIEAEDLEGNREDVTSEYINR